jgi:hypothetical protein
MRPYKILLAAILLSFQISGLAKDIHVSVSAKEKPDGSITRPYKTISEALIYAYPGDTITVHSGTYREWINPVRGGESDSRRIVYRAAPGEIVEIKGSEIIKGWKKEKAGIWKVVIPNTVFGNYNPYRDSIFGDWFDGMGRMHHTGEVFLNGKSLYERESLEKVNNSSPLPNTRDPEGSTYTWYCQSNENTTIIWANFRKYDPNRELVEISVRPTCFYPEKPGINYITISGFRISQAATQWAAPTAEQIGMISTHWNKGWIIENNIISDSKCSGITLGKERSTGHNVWSADPSIDGSIHYIEVTFRAIRKGWNRDNIGSHIIRNNIIFNCEQTGICGSMGAAFSIIENNHIYNIWYKRQFTGAEIAGIKFHAAIDATVRNNRIHDCGRGFWFDWMTQGTRISANLMYNNDLEDLFLEVNHGPFIVDNNILLSPSSIKTQSEGGAFVHNLIAGSVHMWSEPNRFTPYFLPHSTDVAGLSTVYSGDDRFYNNIFCGPADKQGKEQKYKYGLEIYNSARLPVFVKNNVYYSGAKPCTAEKDYIGPAGHSPDIQLVEKGEDVYLSFTPDPTLNKTQGDIITTEYLGKAKVPNALFENPDGTRLVISTDYFGNERKGDKTPAGPFADPGNERITLKVWPKSI